MQSALRLAPYVEQKQRWPRTGRHILAQFDAENVVVYQAYRPAIGHFAAEHGYFGGEFALSRMSWIKPNFLWMMYRCGWATKESQEVVLAVWLAREAFDRILAVAIPSTWNRHRHATREDWQADVARSDVRLQWDPDHDPSGGPLERRAIQLGLRGKVLVDYARASVRRIEDITEFVREQHQRCEREGEGALLTPAEDVYPCEPATAALLGTDVFGEREV